MIITSNDVANGLYVRQKYLKELIMKIVSDPVQSCENLQALTTELIEVQEMSRNLKRGAMYELREVTE